MTNRNVPTGIRQAAMRATSIAVALPATAIAPTHAVSQEKAGAFPDHAVHMRVPYTAGGAADVPRRSGQESVRKNPWPVMAFRYQA